MAVEIELIVLAQALAQILALSAMARSEVVKLLQDGTGMTDEQANEVITYGLTHSLLVEEPAETAGLRGTSKSARRA